MSFLRISIYCPPYFEGLNQDFNSASFLISYCLVTSMSLLRISIYCRAGGTGPAGPAKTGPLFPHILSGNGR